MTAAPRILKSKTLVGSVLLLLIWYALHLFLGSAIVPSPWQTFAALWTLVLEGGLLKHLLFSLMRILVAVVLAMVFGVALGLWAGQSRRADFFITPLAYLLYPLPKVAFLPLFMLLFGLGETAKILLIFSVILFHIILALRDAVKEMPQDLRISMASIDLSKRETYRHLLLPAALPKMISALRVSIGISIATLFFSENFATTYGIGYFIMNAWVMANYVEMFAGILAMSLLGSLLFKLIDLAEKRLCPWL